MYSFFPFVCCFSCLWIFIFSAYCTDCGRLPHFPKRFTVGATQRGRHPRRQGRVVGSVFVVGHRALPASTLRASACRRTRENEYSLSPLASFSFSGLLPSMCWGARVEIVLPVDIVLPCSQIAAEALHPQEPVSNTTLQ